MRKLERYLGIVLLVLLTGMVCSCGKERLSDISSEKVNVTLSLKTRAVAELPGEGIQKLRVIITDDNNNVIRNIVKDYSDNETEKTLYILGLDEGNTNFYVVINENSLGLNLDDWIPDMNKYVQNTVEKSYFPKMSGDIGEYGIPATGYKKGVLLHEGIDNKVFIDCTYAVAKIVLNVTNNSGHEFTVQKVNFGPFFQQDTYLFNNDGKVPSSMNPKEHSFLLNRNIPVTPESGVPTQSLVCYLFETGQNISPEDYTVALEVEGIDFLKDPAQIRFDSNANLLRGYQLNLNAKVTGTEITYGPVSVEPWKEQIIDLE